MTWMKRDSIVGWMIRARVAGPVPNWKNGLIGRPGGARVAGRTGCNRMVRARSAGSRTARSIRIDGR